MSPPRDIVMTWPKKKPLDEYLHELERAVALGQVINYRVAHLPMQLPRHCYMVHDGYIRGWCRVLGLVTRGEKEVAVVGDRSGDGYWPAGKYIVRDPVWYEVCPTPMRGFQGWRWYDHYDYWKHEEER